MLAHAAALVVANGAGGFLNVAVQKLAEGPLANKANAGAVFLFGVGQANRVGNAAHLGFGQLAHREQRLRQLRLVEPVQKIALVFEWV